MYVCLILLFPRKDVAGSPAEVLVTGGDSTLHIRTPRGELSLALPAGVNHEQGSCMLTPSGELCGDELHFRLGISVNQSADEGNAQEHGSTQRHVLCFPRRNKVFSYLYCDTLCSFCKILHSELICLSLLGPLRRWRWNPLSQDIQQPIYN